MSVVQSTKTEPGICSLVVLIASADILGVLPSLAKILGLDVAANVDDLESRLGQAARQAIRGLTSVPGRMESDIYDSSRSTDPRQGM